MKSEKTSRTSRQEEPGLPTPEQAAEAFKPALVQRSTRVRAELLRLAGSPPQVVLLEGGSVAERYAMSLWYTALLNCSSPKSLSALLSSTESPSGNPPCLCCPDCLKIGANMFSDLHVLDGREGSIKIEAVRDLRVVLGEAPRGSGMRVIVLVEAQALGVEAANALLKSLEEPRPGLCFLLLTPQRERLLPTLVSRGWTITLPWPDPAAPTPVELCSWENDLATFLNTGQGWFDRTASKGSVDANLARQVLLIVQKALVNVPAQRDGGPLGKIFVSLPDAGRLYVTDILNQCLQSLSYLVNPTLVLDWLAIRLFLACRRTRKRL